MISINKQMHLQGVGSSVLVLISVPVMTSGQWRLVGVGGSFFACVCCTAFLPRRLNGSERRVGGGRKKASADDYLLAFVVFTVEEFPLSHRNTPGCGHSLHPSGMGLIFLFSSFYSLHGTLWPDVDICCVHM